MQNKNKKNGLVLIASIFLFLSVLFFSYSRDQISVFADGTDSLYITSSGSLALGFDLTNILFPQAYQQSATWSWNETNDYITFLDSTTTEGFRINMYMSSTAGGDFVYTGSSAAQPDIDVGNFHIWGGFNSSTGLYEAPTKGLDDSAASLNIFSSDTCDEGENLSNYFFNDFLNSAGNDYKLTMSSSEQLYLKSTVTCKTTGTVDIRKMKLYYPDGSNAGQYSSELVITVVDGSLINPQTVTFDNNGGTTEANPRTKTVEYNDNVGTLPSPPTKSGYTFDGWNTQADGGGSEFTATTPVSGNITVYAQWAEVLYALRDTGPGGGLVFYITDGGLHGLESSTSDQGTGQWGCVGTLISGADGTAVGTGSQNTTDILAGCAMRPIAASLAQAYSGGGLNDWFLPSKDEFALMYTNLILYNVGNFTNSAYWTSSEVNNFNAWLAIVDDGSSVSFGKSQPNYYIRAIRAF